MPGVTPSAPRSRRRGIAVVLVLGVLLALVLVGTPFVLSMLELERSGRTTLAQEEVEWLVNSSRTAAIAWALEGTEDRERSSRRWPWTSYSCDTLAEFAFDWRLLDPSLSPGLGRRAGVLLSDEQGKLPLRCASPEVARLLAALTSRAPRDWKDLTTLYSLPESKWVGPYRLPEGPPDLREGCGATVRITRPGAQPVVRTWDPSLVVSEGETAYLEVLLPEEVNILTAPREVLVAILEPIVRLDGAALGRRKAQTVADAIRERQPRDFDELNDLLEALGSLDPADRVAVLQNALNPYTRAIVSGTVPLTFVSRDVVSADIVAVLLGPAGLPRARRRVREVLAVASPLGTEWRIEGPADFERYLRLWPSPLLAVGDDWLQLRPAQDLRGSARTVRHFEEEFEGLWVAEGEELSFPWGEVFTFAQGMHDVRAGGVEMWIRFDGDPPPSRVLFDVREGDFANRLSVEIAGGDLVLTAADASLPTLPGPPGLPGRRLAGISRYRIAIAVAPRTWTHVGGYWKGTKLGHLAALVDGFSHAEARFEIVDESGRPLTTVLAGDVPVDATVLPLADSRLLDPVRPTALEIGDEVFVYDPATGVAARGQRRTRAADHPAGAKVSLFGYAQKVARARVTLPWLEVDLDRLTRGGGVVTAAFGTEIQAMLANEELLDESGMRLGLKAQTTTLEVRDAADITHFPQRGYLLVGMASFEVTPQGIQLRGQLNQEVVYYEGVGATGAQRGSFLNCRRGELGTQARDWVTKVRTPDGEREVPVPVFLYSVEVSTNVEYLAPAVLQIDDEWFFLRKHPDLATYWLGPEFVLGNLGSLFVPLTFVRGFLNTGAAAHADGAKVIPVFYSRHTGLGPVNHWQAGPGDVVTVLDGQGNREVAEVRRAAAGPEDAPLGIQGQFVGFADWVSREYLADDPEARFLKFPSGELLSREWLLRAQPAVRVAPGPVEVDEVKVFAEDKGDFRMMEARVVGWEGPTPFTSVAALPDGGGILVVGDEIVAYDRKVGDALEIGARGFLGSPQRAHAYGERAFNLSGILPVASVAEPLDASGAVLRMSQPVRANPEGYVYVDAEMIGYTAMAELGLSMPADFDGRGLYRGRFGTTAAGHNPGALVYFPPFRYRDTADDSGFFDPTMADFQAGRVLPGARWREVRLEAGGLDETMELWVDARVGDRAAWLDPPAGPRNGRFAFRESSRPLRLEAMGDPIELRVAFAYLPGAFHPAHGWKRTGELRQVRVTAQAPTLTLHHDEP